MPSTYFRSRSQRLQPWNPYLTSQGINQSSLFSLKFRLLRTTVNANTAEISPCCITPSVQESPKAWACSILFQSPDNFFLHHQLFLHAGHHLRGGSGFWFFPSPNLILLPHVQSTSVVLQAPKARPGQPSIVM